MTSEMDIRSASAIDPMAPPTPIRGRGQTGRALVKGLAWSGAASLVVAVVLFLGWRYGLSPLPRPVDGIRYEPTSPLAWNDIGPENCWYWAREVDRLVQAARLEAPRQSQYLYRLTSDPWAELDTRSDTNRTDSERWFTESPQLDLILSRAVTTTDNRPPSHFGGTETRAMALLTHLPLTRAAALDRAGETARALEQLLNAWRLQARLVPHVEFPGLLDERGLGELDHKLGQPWRRMTVASPGLSAAEARVLLDKLTAITNALPDLALSYRRIVTTWMASTQPLREADWGRVRRAFSQAVTLATQDLVQIPTAIWARLSGYRVNFTHMEGVGHFARPLILLGESLQKSALRTADLEAAIQGATSQAIGRLHAGTHSAFDLTSPGFGQRWLDRPALWRTLRTLPDEADLVRSQQHWLACFESCRLALALRIYREEQGEWPAQLAALTPGILQELPTDPRSGRPFGYGQTREGWRLWSPGPETSPASEGSARNSDGRLIFEASTE